MSDRPLVFVSCGQETDAEKKLGTDIIALVRRSADRDAYFAETVTSLDGLSASIFKNLARASAFITVMHHRGVVKGRPGDADRTRASVWIEQEIAIAAFLKYTRPFDLQVAAYAQRDLDLEGVRQVLHLNATPFDKEDEVLADVERTLASWDLRPSRSADPRLDVTLDYEKATNSDGKRHQYQLKALLKNTSDVVIPGVDFRITFPKRFLLTNWSYQGERRHSETETHRIFEDKEYSINIAPGEEYPRHLTVYQMTTDLHIRDRGEMNLPVTVDVYMDRRRIGSVTKPFKELQIF
jgi:hypothetical protein